MRPLEGHGIELGLEALPNRLADMSVVVSFGQAEGMRLDAYNMLHLARY